jgi:hypothetical protein
VYAASSPGGAWRRLGEGLDGREVHSLHQSGAGVLAGTDRGLFELKPFEAVWMSVGSVSASGGRGVRVNDLSGLPNGSVAAATSKGLWRTDGGGVWTSPFVDEVEVTAVALSPMGRMSVAATATGFVGSRDEGRTWTPMPRPGAARVNALVAVPGEPPLLLAATALGLYRSEDEGASWIAGALDLPDSDYTSLVVVSNRGLMFVSDFTWGGVFRSDDRGLSWRRLSAEGLLTDRVWVLALSPIGPELLAGPSAGGLHRLQFR